MTDKPDNVFTVVPKSAPVANDNKPGDPEIVAAIRQLADAFEDGAADNISICASINGEYLSICDFQDGWRLLGALEYAKVRVARAIGNQS